MFTRDFIICAMSSQLVSLEIGLWNKFKRAKAIRRFIIVCQSCIMSWQRKDFEFLFKSTKNLFYYPATFRDKSWGICFNSIKLNKLGTINMQILFLLVIKKFTISRKPLSTKTMSSLWMVFISSEHLLKQSSNIIASLWVASNGPKTKNTQPSGKQPTIDLTSGIFSAHATIPA